MDACNKGRVSKWVSKEYSEDDSKPFTFPESLADFDTNWRFQCTHAAYCASNPRYDFATGQPVQDPHLRDWQAMVSFSLTMISYANFLSRSNTCRHTMIKHKK